MWRYSVGYTSVAQGLRNCARVMTKRSCWGRRSGASAPVVDYIRVGVAVARFVWPVHCHALQAGAESTVDHALVGVWTAQVHPGVELPQSALGRESFALIEQAVEPRRRPAPAVPRRT
jgi:hypothetical protein